MRRKYFVLIPLLTILFIWGNSLMPASISHILSGYARESINLLFHSVGDTTILSNDSGVRKLAHVIEYGVLGLSLTWLVRDRLEIKLAAVALSGFLISLIDETIQLFSTGRSSEIKDIWIDFSGFMTGMLVVLCMAGIRKKQERAGVKHEKVKNNH